MNDRPNSMTSFCCQAKCQIMCRGYVKIKFNLRCQVIFRGYVEVKRQVMSGACAKVKRQVASNVKVKCQMKR